VTSEGESAAPEEALPEAAPTSARIASRWRDLGRWASSSDVRRTMRDIVIPVLAIRVVLMIFGWLAVIVYYPGATNDGFLGIWNRWDGPHFLELAATGYGPPTDPARIVLFPLFPLAIKIGSFFLAPLAAAMAISLVSTVVAAVGLDRLVRLDGPPRLARMSVLALVAFPTAYALIAPYSEALFLALAVWAFVAIRRDDVRLAGVLGALAALTRIQGIFLLPALGLEYLMIRRRLDRDVLWLALMGVGLAVYLAINQIYFGDPLRFVAVQESTFHVRNTLPWVAVGDLVNSVATAQPNEGWVTVFLAPLASFMLLAWVTAWTLMSRHSRPSYAVYTGISLIAFASLNWPISVPRYILGVFPMFIALGSAYRTAVGQALLVAGVMLMALFTGLFVIGHWAF
jgi:Gpi18-like mannosyltransferase